jgi:hypothetical protein
MMKAIVETATGKVKHINGGPFGIMVCDLPGFEIVEIPEQDIRPFYRYDKGAEADVIREITLPDLRLYTAEETAAIERPQKARDRLREIKLTDRPTIEGLAEEVRLLREILGV